MYSFARVLADYTYFYEIDNILNMMKSLHLIFSHQGGWDEILLVVAPLGLIAWLLWIANRKAEKMTPEKKSDFEAENDSKYSDD